MGQVETVEAKGESEGMTAKDASCAVCGKPRGEWTARGGRGVEKEDVVCCCAVCAEQLDAPPSLRSHVAARHVCPPNS